MKNIFKPLSDQKIFIDNLKNNQLGCIKIAILREVSNPLIIRSTSPDEILSHKMPNGKDVVEIPARKLKSREKLRGLKQVRNFDCIDPSVRYNLIADKKLLANINSITFGDTVVKKNDPVGLSSRAIYDWGYSIQDIEQISDTLQHNALSEGGTMYDEEKGKLRQSLFQVQYITPGTLIPHFITLENATEAMLVHLLSTVIYEHRYGAQSTTTGSNMNNHIIGIGYGKQEAPFNSYLISKDWEEGISPTVENVSKAINSRMEDFYGENLLSGTEVTDYIQFLWEKDDKGTLEGLYKSFDGVAKQFFKDIKIK